ncbi:hypothetical protein ACS0TY_023205 [Phlomoides rotata]
MNPRKQKPFEESTKRVILLTPNSSVKSSVTVDWSPSSIRDSSYFPGCKKDANCSCEICIASINATLDLVPQSSHRHSFKKIPASKISVSRTPVSFNPDFDVPTPKSRDSDDVVLDSPPPRFAERVRFQEKVKKRRKVELGYGSLVMRIFWGLILVFGVDYGISSMVSGVFEARLSTDIVKNLGSKSREFDSLGRRFLFLKEELEEIVGKEVLSCNSNDDSLWKIEQDGMLLNSRCVLYKSMVEEVSIWGWPLQTSGLLASSYSSRSFTSISGSVTELSLGGTGYSVRKDENSSWTQGKWSTSVVQFDPNTWILEYRRSFLVDNANLLLSSAMDFLKFRLRKEFRKMRHEFWAFGNQLVERIPPPPPT